MESVKPTKRSRRWFPILLATSLLFLGAVYFHRLLMAMPRPVVLVSAEADGLVVGPIQTLGDGRWTRTFRAADGTLFLPGRMQSRDGGRTVLPQTDVDVEAINASPERAVFARQGMFYALDGPAELVSPGVYHVRAWRSIDGLQHLTTETVRLEVPEGPTNPRQEGEWSGLYVYRTILEMPDKSWLLTMYGNFAPDTLIPPDKSSQREVKYMMRSFVLTSRDEGRSWRYLATIAAPREGDPIGEGFVEPAITRLADGRLLCVLRTGHHYPLYACWSSDGAQSWTAPVYTGLDRGCDPCLITLADGRVALSWGRRYPEGWSQLDAQGDAVRFQYPGVGVVNLALSNDGGMTWHNRKVAQKTGSSYSTIFEIEPNVIFCQVDRWYWRITIRAPQT